MYYLADIQSSSGSSPNGILLGIIIGLFLVILICFRK